MCVCVRVRVCVRGEQKERERGKEKGAGGGREGGLIRNLVLCFYFFSWSDFCALPWSFRRQTSGEETSRANAFQLCLFSIQRFT